MRVMMVAWLAFAIFVGAVPAGGAQDSDFTSQVKEPVREAVDIRQSTQKEEARWREERQKLVAVYEQLQEEEKQLQVQHEQLQEKTAAAKERIMAKERQLADIAQISSQIDPFLQELVERLEKLSANDLPFLIAERRQRIQRLNDLMHDPEVAVSEKLRKAMEALLVEAEYGQTIEVYQQTISIENQSMLVNIFRLGRISLFYQRLDQQTCGYYDVSAAAWQPLPASYNRAIQAAMDIGARRRPVEMLTLPIGRLDQK